MNVIEICVLCQQSNNNNRYANKDMIEESDEQLKEIMSSLK